MNSDLEELLKIFNANSVRFLIVGGYAVMHYTEPRYTKDLDIWVEASTENADRVFTREGFFYQIGMPPVPVDILMSIDGVSFSQAWENRKTSELGAQPVWFIRACSHYTQRFNDESE
jgi:hypothetical protein